MNGKNIRLYYHCNDWYVLPSEKYKDKLIEFTEKELSIDGKVIPIEIDQSGKYMSEKFPYSSFDSMLDLARAIVDNM